MVSFGIMSCFSNIANREKGALNIATFAVALPILLLLAAGAMDIVRLPLAKQQILSTASSSYDALLVDGQFPEQFQTLASQNLCSVLSEELKKESCPKCSSRAKDCSIEYERSAQALDSAVDFILKDLTEQTSPVFQHHAEDISIQAAIFKLEVTPDGALDSINIVAQRAISPENGVKPETDLISYVTDCFDLAAKPKLGIFKQSDGAGSAEYTGTAIAAIRVSVRVSHIFGLTKRLTSRISSSSESGEDSWSIITANLIRPLSKSISFRLPPSDKPRKR